LLMCFVQLRIATCSGQVEAGLKKELCNSKSR